MILVSLGATANARAAIQPTDGFDPNANGIVNSVVLQPDGKILIGGYFTQLKPFGQPGSSNAYIARLNPNGTVDSTFSPNANGVVRTILLQPNGQIVVAGNFTSIQPTGSASQLTRNYVARLNSDGTLDSQFNPNTNGVVYAVAYQANGQILIGGSFTQVQANGAASPTTRNHIARLNADGSLDTGFDPNTDRPVLSLAVQANGQIIVGGGFSTFQPNGATSTTTRSCAARLNSDGSMDTGFDPEPNGSVDALLILPSGQIIMGGQFVTLQPNGAPSNTQCDFLARLNTDGTLDNTFIINPLASVTTVALQPDGRLIIGGIFTQIFPNTSLASSAVSFAARIYPDGTLDGTFIPQPNQAVNAIAVQPDGDIILGGYFTGLNPLDTTVTYNRNFIARVSGDGVPDATLEPDSLGTIFAAATTPSGQTLVGGTFLSIGGTTQNYMARMNADGTLDTSFRPTFNGPVQAIVLQPNGQILVGGSFNEVDGFVRNYFTRLNADGSIDGAFNPNPNANITEIALQSDGRILMSGGFSAVTPNGSTSSYVISNFGRINADGSLDTTFNPAPNGAVFAIAFQSDGRIVVGGGFTQIGGFTRSYIARLLPSGLIDPAPFDPEGNGAVFAVNIQPDGKILVGGSFTGLFPQTNKSGTPTTSTGPYGTITLPAPGTSATTPIYINHLARLNTDGTLDTTFFPDPSSDVLSLALQPDGSILVGGTQTSFAQNGSPTGIVRNFIGRVETDGKTDPGFNPNANDLVNSVSLLSSGNILIAGSFTTLQPAGAASPTFANHIAVLNPDGSINPSFSAGGMPTATGQVTAMAVQPNGQLLIGGSFSALGGVPGNYFGRFNADASPDVSYNASVDGPVNSISIEPKGAATQTPSNSGVWLEPNGTIRHSYSASTNGEVVCALQQPDGKVLIGGLFTNFGGSSTSQNMIRLNVDGTVDTSFAPVPNGVVNAMLLQPDGKIVIGGGFTNVDATNNAYLARLNPDGTIDASFAPQPNLQVLSMILQSDGKIIVGGDFTILTPAGATVVTPFNYLARVNTDGTIDATFNPEPDGPVYAIAIPTSGKILIGGSFTTIQPNLGTTTYSVQDFARLNSDGSVDTTFYPDPNGPVSAIIVQTDGRFVIGGTFTEFQQNANITNVTAGPVTTANFIARVNPDGTLDTTFNPDPNGPVVSLSLQPNGQLLVAGSFSSLQPNGTGFPSNRYHIARINVTGTLDPSFDPGLNGTVDTVDILSDGSMFVGGNFTAVQVGGAVLIGGNFANIQGNSSPNLGRLNSDGTFDSSYVAHPDGPVNAIIPQVDGKTLIGGSFSNIDGQAESNLVRLNNDGTLDSGFSAPTNGTVNAVALEQDGEILVAGSFTTVAGQNASHLARLQPAGAPETAFSPSINGTVNSVLAQANGQVMVAGAFTTVDGQAAGGIARLNSDGTLDTTFSANANGTVQAITQQVDGTYYVAGTFTSISGQPITNAAHLTSAGAVDPSFNPNPNGTVNALAVQEDGKVALGGSFTVAGGLVRYELARFAPPTPVVQTIAASTDQSTITWTRTGSAPVFYSVQFEESLDGNVWNVVGNATTTDGVTWQLSGLAPTGEPAYFVRATGVIPSSQFSSSGLIQEVYLANSLATPTVNSAPIANGVSGSAFAFTVTATQSPKTFSASGLPPGLTINGSTGMISGTPTGSGTYSVTVTVGGSGGSTVSALTISIGAPSGTRFSAAATSLANRLLNLSSRTQLTGNQVLIAGFVVSGTGTKTLLFRAVGPGLSSFGVANVMATPELQIYSSSGALMTQNTGWAGSSALKATFSQVGAFALPAGSADAALVTDLAPGSYTVHVFDPAGNGGIVLAEIYDASASPMTAPQRLINISARGTVSPGAGALIGGFVISGDSMKSVLIRGIGPGLTGFGVTDSISDPVLSVFDANGTLVAQNLSWSSQEITGADQATITAQDITSNDATVGAFALSPLNPDTALIANLPPGAYTFQVTSASKATGEALGEVYELP